MPDEFFLVAFCMSIINYREQNDKMIKWQDKTCLNWKIINNLGKKNLMFY
jgi:hypothetical protein